MMNRHVEMDYHLVLLYVCLTVNMSKNSTRRDDERETDVNSRNKPTKKNGKDNLNKDFDAGQGRKCGSCNEAPMSHKESNESILDEDLYGTSHKYLANLEILRAKLNLVRLDGEGEGKSGKRSSTNVDNLRVESSNDNEKLTKKKSIFAVTSNEKADTSNVNIEDDLDYNSEDYYKLLDEDFSNEEQNYCWSATFRNDFSLETIPEMPGSDADLESVRTSTTDSYTPPRKRMCSRSNNSSKTPSCISIPCSVVEYYSYKSDDSSGKSENLMDCKREPFDESLAINLPSSICDSNSSTKTATSVEKHLTIIENEECFSSDTSETHKFFNHTPHSYYEDDSSDSESNENLERIQIPILTRKKALTDLQNADSRDIILENIYRKPNSSKKVKELEMHCIGNEYNVRHSVITQCNFNSEVEKKSSKHEVCTTTSFLSDINCVNLKSPTITYCDDYKSEESSLSSSIESSEKFYGSSNIKNTTPTLVEKRRCASITKGSLKNTRSDSVLFSTKKLHPSKCSPMKSVEFVQSKTLGIQEKEENLEPFLGSLEVPKLTTDKVSSKSVEMANEEATIPFYFTTTSLTIPKIFCSPYAFPAFTKIATIAGSPIGLSNRNIYLEEQTQDDCGRELNDARSTSKNFVSYKTVASELIIKSKTDVATSSVSAINKEETTAKDSSKSVAISRKAQSTDITFYTVPSPTQSENEPKNDEPTLKFSTSSDSDSIGKGSKICPGCFCKKLFFTRRRKRFFS